MTPSTCSTPPGTRTHPTPIAWSASSGHVAFATGILERGIAAAQAGARARGLVAEAIAGAADPRVIELDRAMPWHQAVVAGAPEALYVVYPKKSDDWRLQAVPVRLGDFENRRDLPAAWAGLEGEELVALTGVQDARFCHNARFLVTARSQAGIRELARLALDGPGRASTLYSGVR